MPECSRIGEITLYCSNFPGNFCCFAELVFIDYCVFREGGEFVSAPEGASGSPPKGGTVSFSFARKQQPVSTRTDVFSGVGGEQLHGAAPDALPGDAESQADAGGAAAQPAGGSLI